MSETETPYTAPNEDPVRESQGSIPYILTRLDYLEIKVNIDFNNFFDWDKLSFICIASPHEDKISVKIYYTSDGFRKMAVDRLNECREIITSWITNLGWDWVEIEEEIEFISN